MPFQRRFFLLLILLLAVGGAVGQQPTTHTLMISAQSLTSEPIAGVRMQHSFQGEETAFATNDLGTVQVTVRRDAEIRDGRDIEVLDPRFRMLRVSERPGNGRRVSRFVTFRLYRTDPERMSPAERHQYILTLPEILAAERERAGALPGAPGTPNALRLSAFLEGFRQETSISGDEMRARIQQELEPPLELEEEAPAGPTLRATVVDAHGNRLAGRPVLLFTIEEETGMILPASNRRTDVRGEVTFDGLETGRLYRIEAPSQGDDLVARSPVLRLEEGRKISFPALILHQRGRTLSGMAFHNDQPLANAEVSVVGRSSLTSVTDRFGYFQLGPFEMGTQAKLRFRLPGDRAADFVAPVGEQELFIPVDLLAVEN